jgi:hypothetical protein
LLLIDAIGVFFQIDQVAVRMPTAKNFDRSGTLSLIAKRPSAAVAIQMQ